ncbi:hypothetical protein Hanom_Chr06g00525071 [Helianthus anomalus]
MIAKLFILIDANEVVVEWLGKKLDVSCDPIRLTLPIIFAASRKRANTGSAGSSWMGCEILPIIPLSCLRAGGGRVSAHLGEPRGWQRSSNRP